MKPIKMLILSAVAVFSTTSTILAQQSNFQFMPAPIAYPYFEPGRRDIALGVDKFSISGGPVGSEFDIDGVGAHFIFRHAATEVIGIDAGLGAYGMSGDVPGFALPFYYSGNIWMPVIEGDADLTGFGMPLFANLEVQPINKPAGSLILFGGPNMTIASMSMETPYHAVVGNTAAARTNFTTDATVVLGGVQFGVQAGIRVGPFRVAPFAMALFQSGSATFTFENGYQNTVDFVEDTVVDIEPYGVQVYGFDVVYEPWNLSLGGVFQKTSDKDEQAGYETSMFTLAYHFRSK